MERTLLTRAGRKIYKQRAQSVECVFGQMEGRGLNDFLLRGVKEGRWGVVALLRYAQSAEGLARRFETGTEIGFSGLVAAGYFCP